MTKQDKINVLAEFAGIDQEGFAPDTIKEDCMQVIDYIHTLLNRTGYNMHRTKDVLVFIEAMTSIQINTTNDMFEACYKWIKRRS